MPPAWTINRTNSNTGLGAGGSQLFKVNGSYYLFNYATKQLGGYADFDFFHISKQIAE